MLPAEPGTYVLMLRSSSNGNIRIGRLGILPLRPGDSLFGRSAFGPGGLRARIEHHARRTIPTRHADPRDWSPVRYYYGARREHELAAACAVTPMPGFGSSD
jgi:Uri superfamily endonuclease